MSTVPFTRRDARHDLSRGSSFVELPYPVSKTDHTSAALTRISVAGLAFETTSEPTLDVGAIVAGVTVRVGDCRLRGDLVVQALATTAPPVEVGCLFYPAAPADADRLMALIAGIEAARSRS